MAKRKIPTADRVREILHYNPDTGQIFWIQPRRGCRLYLEAGNVHDGYKRISIDGRGFAAHIIIWLYMTGEYPSGIIDHINTNKLDNRWINLRLVTQQKNTWNRKRSIQYASRYGTGVSKTPEGRFRAVIQRQYLGNYDTPEQAQEAYAKAAERLFGTYSQVKSNGVVISRRTRHIPRIDNISGFVGVGRHQKRWRARYKGRQVGCFDTPEEAHQALLKLKRSD